MHLVITILWTEWTISLHKRVYTVQNILIEAEEYLHTILKCILAGIAVFAEKTQSVHTWENYVDICKKICLQNSSS